MNLTLPFNQALISKDSSQAGLTLIELLVIVTIIAVVLILLVLSIPRQLGRARDSQRKSDLEKIKVAFEDYYNDHHCYP
ncbi:MAG: hypothetical protein GF390_01005, partial [Candidatus Pacebacteria bacterium]|nr:hypothetical protein [Candidatus Paceibacterota bacterium]